MHIHLIDITFSLFTVTIRYFVSIQDIHQLTVGFGFQISSTKHIYLLIYNIYIYIKIVSFIVR